MKAFIIALLLAVPALAQKRLVIIDQDGAGPADGNQMAMMTLLQSPQVEVVGITIVTGDAWRDEEVQHMLRMLELIGRTNVPVVPGAVFPLEGSPPVRGRPAPTLPSMTASRPSAQRDGCLPASRTDHDLRRRPADERRPRDRHRSEIRGADPGYSKERYFMYDELAACAWLDPAIITKSHDFYMDVDLSHGPGYGQTLTWLEKYKPATDVQLVHAQVDVDVDRYTKVFLDLMSH